MAAQSVGVRGADAGVDEPERDDAGVDSGLQQEDLDGGGDAGGAHLPPGLYFLFSSKETLFRAAVTQALERDITAVEHVLADVGRPLRERIVEAFDHWAGGISAR